MPTETLSNRLADLKMSDSLKPTDQKTTTRTINTLPPMRTTDYTPHANIEFDVAVQEFCLNRSNHILHRKGADIPHKSSKNKINSYNSVYAPFNKIVRNCKVVVSGDVAVGKTCLVNRFGHDLYSSNYQTTIGVDFDIQRFNILGQPYLLQIWDTAGLERFKCITNSYYRGCQVALLVFDVSNMSTLANVLRWKDEVLCSSSTFDQLSTEQVPNEKSSQQQSNQPLLFLVGTKWDLPISESRKVFIKEQANKIADILKAELWFVSAQTGENVHELFNRVAAISFNHCILREIQRLKFEASTIGASLKEKIWHQQKELWLQSSKLIKITKKKEGDEKRTKCVNVQCVIK